MGKLDKCAEHAIDLPQLDAPFLGQPTGFNRQQALAEFSRKNRIIAGKGICIKQTPHGQVIEAKNIQQNILYTPTPSAYTGIVVAASEDGTLRADIYAHGVLTSFGDEAYKKANCLKRNVVVFPTIMNTWQAGLKVDDIIIAHPTVVLTAGLEEVSETEIGVE